MRLKVNVICHLKSSHLKPSCIVYSLTAGRLLTSTLRAVDRNAEIPNRRSLLPAGPDSYFVGKTKT